MQKQSAQSPYTAVVFDLDGTLANTIPTVARLYSQVLHQHTGRQWTLAELLQYFGPPEDIIFERITNDKTLSATMLAEYYRLSEVHGAEFQAFAGIAEVLTRLRALDVRLGVFTSGVTAAALIRLRHAGLLDFFEAVIGGDQVTNYKPHPEGLQRLLRQFEVEPQTTLFIGDSPLDVQAGRAAGAKTAGVLWGAGTREALADAQPAELFEHPQQLLQFIK
ncbi:MAG: HAD-IA family hydrolase [Acidobacteria bacterium]|nr:HAD-IA family hydrolase [Acidobacteriota bacterium]MBI3425752.1 HAD-IA family hydrolase [Acidobacteriota bacterium]